MSSISLTVMSFMTKVLIDSLMNVYLRIPYRLRQIYNRVMLISDWKILAQGDPLGLLRAVAIWAQVVQLSRAKGPF